MSAIRRGVTLLAGTTLGGALGGLLFVGLALALGAARDPAAATSDARFGLWAAAGASVSLVATAEFADVRPVQRFIRLTAGAAAGAVTAAGAYALGYVAVMHADVGLSPALLAHLEAAFLSGTRLEAVLAALGAGLGAIAARYSWRLPGLVAYIGLVAVTGGYVLYALTVSLPQTPASALPLSITLFIAEAATLTLVIVYAFYALDVYQRQRWDRAPARRPFSIFYQPKVAFQVATFNEPPELVRDTLDALVRVDYPDDRYIVQVCDDSTDAEAAAALERMCEERGFQYIHREKRGGFKAGALNHALRHHTPKDVDVIAVIDADYQVRPEYLKETVGYFIDPRLGFVQTPQDYRNREETFLTKQYYLADAFFYKAVLPSRNEGNAIIFCGTMGLVRRKALEEAGGWGETFICEDAELSVRIFSKAWNALYVDKTYGHGLIPATYDAYKKQHTRWAFGCVKILRHYWARFLFGRMSVRQKTDFFLGNLHWFDGVFTFIIAATLGTLAIGDFFGFRPVTHHQRDLALFALIPVFFLVDGVLRIHGALRSAMPVGFFDTLKTLGMWLSIKFATSFAAVKSLIGFKMPFVRTPKDVTGNLTRAKALGQAVNLTRVESVMTVFMAVAAALAAQQAWAMGPATPGFIGRVFLGIWCTFYAIVFACAPLYAYLGYRTFQTPPPASGAAGAAPG